MTRTGTRRASNCGRVEPPHRSGRAYGSFSIYPALLNAAIMQIHQATRLLQETCALKRHPKNPGALNSQPSTLNLLEPPQGGHLSGGVIAGGIGIAGAGIGSDDNGAVAVGRGPDHGVKRRV